MSLGARFFLGYFLVVGLGAYFLINTFMSELRPGVRQSMEDALVDTANLLAEVVEDDVKRGNMPQSAFAKQVDDFLSRRVNARIWEYTKSRAAYRIYITDAEGIVLYDSDNGKAVGRDYSKWNDIYLTLRGQYGVRSTKADPNDPESSIMYVAAPIRSGERIIGVLTVAKPNVSVQPFIELSQRKMLHASAGLVALSLALGLLFSWWFARSISQLSEYAQKASRGERAPLPKLGSPELAKLGAAVEHMREELEGRKYVEQYVQTLTHELKSPLSALLGAAELLEEDMPEADRKRFTENIRKESLRIQTIVDRMLDQAMIEHRQALEHAEAIDMPVLVNELLSAKQAVLERKSIAVSTALEDAKGLIGERFLLRQALHNLLDNALAFTPAGGCIHITGAVKHERYVFCLHDSGTGIPEYAHGRLFERFYSLPRPETGQRSTGLGLSFVREVAELHGGDITLKNHPDGGTLATLTLPLGR